MILSITVKDLLQKCVFFLLFTSFIRDCWCLRDVRAQIPPAVLRGERTSLMCLFDLEHDQLYSVKWYKAEREFYRYVPKENPPMKVFPLSGIVVVKKHSNASMVTLDDVGDAAGGRYTCEVSADAPSFLTYVVNGTMDIIDTPPHRPQISGIKPRYRISSLLKGNCTCRNSRPAANLTWYINGHQANPSYIKRYRNHIDEDGFYTASLGIHFLITPEHFHSGKLKIRCTASMYGIYWQITEKSIEEERVRSVPSNEVVGVRREAVGSVAHMESQHVALVYPVHGTSYDQDPPPNTHHRDDNIIPSGCCMLSSLSSWRLYVGIMSMYVILMCHVR